MARRKRSHGDGGGGGGHDGAGSLRWLLTYADMITLLMAFFIMMYSMSVLNLTKFAQVAFSIRSGFGGMLAGSGAHIFQTQGSKSEIQSRQLTSSEVAVENAQKQLRESLTQAGYNSSQVDVHQEERGVVISIAAEELLFPRGSATLTSRASRVLDPVSHALTGLPNAVIVEGHTCTQPIATAQYPSNWELSGARAACVVRYLEVHGITSTRMAAVGYGETHPLVPNTTEAQRIKNRRVDIVIMGDTSATVEPSSSPVSTSGTIRSELHRSIHSNFNKVWTQMRQEGGTP